MLLSFVSTLQYPAPTPSTHKIISSRLAHKELQLSYAVRLKNALQAASDNNPGLQQVKAARVIRRSDYPKIATLKLAGRSDEGIAKMFRVTLSDIRPHIFRAMSEFKQGKIKVDMKEVSDESKLVIEERSKLASEAVAQLQNPILPAETLNISTEA